MEDGVDPSADGVHPDHPVPDQADQEGEQGEVGVLVDDLPGGQQRQAGHAEVGHRGREDALAQA